jgi:hypothetical protein
VRSKYRQATIYVLKNRFVINQAIENHFLLKHEPSNDNYKLVLKTFKETKHCLEETSMPKQDSHHSYQTIKNHVLSKISHNCITQGVSIYINSIQTYTQAKSSNMPSIMDH